MSRTKSSYSIYIEGKADQSLGLLVENQGHINYGDMFDLKVICSPFVLFSKHKHTFGDPLDLYLKLVNNAKQVEEG